MSAVAAHPGFEHSALVHDGADDLGARLAPIVTGAVERGEAVLMCTAPDAWEVVAPRLGEAAGAVRWIPAGARYATPGLAMAALLRFAEDAVDGGSSRAWSIGAVPYDGTVDDARWARYEAAVADVAAHLPLAALCTYDLRSTPHGALGTVRAAHPCVHGGDALPAAGTGVLHDDGAGLVPDGPPGISLRDPSPTAARAAVRAVLSSGFGEDRTADLDLVVTELVTNALRHGRPPVELRGWLAADGAVVVQVRDRGDGVADRYADLRPPAAATAEGGRGLWIVGQLADRLVLDGGLVTARLRP